MPVHNSDIERIFSEVADLLEIEGEKGPPTRNTALGTPNPFRVRAYRNAARTVAGLSQSVADLVARGEDLSQLPGIGKDLAGKVAEVVRTGTLPSLLELDDIRGDLHVHTRRTDGHDTIAELVEAARKRRYEYLAVTDHSRHVTVAHGLKTDQLREQIWEIDRINEKLKGFTVLKATEVDILDDGALDLPDNVLAELDLTVCSVHFRFNLTRKQQTERIIKAMKNRHFNILAHPTGRLINEREPYQVDMEEIMKAAADRGCFLEVNGHPDRLDLNDAHCRLAKDAGVKVALSTDAHRLGDFDYMRFGVGQARRGWLEARDVINTRGLNELQKLLKR